MSRLFGNILGGISTSNMLGMSNSTMSNQAAIAQQQSIVRHTLQNQQAIKPDPSIISADDMTKQLLIKMSKPADMIKRLSSELIIWCSSQPEQNDLLELAWEHDITARLTTIKSVDINTTIVIGVEFKTIEDAVQMKLIKG